MEMTLDEIVREMNELEQHMQKFEWKYSIKSAEFYKLVLAGKIEETFELHEWLGLYKLWLDFHEKYLELLKSPSSLLKFAQPIEDDFFKMKERIMKKLSVDQTDLEIPEIPPNAILRPARHRPAANARIPRKKTLLEVDVDLIAWFKGEAENGGLNYTDHINKALRQYIIDLVGDKPVARPRHLRQKAEKPIAETLAEKDFAPAAIY